MQITGGRAWANRLSVTVGNEPLAFVVSLSKIAGPMLRGRQNMARTRLGEDDGPEDAIGDEADRRQRDAERLVRDDEIGRELDGACALPPSPSALV
jgi:hypothetical protein